MLEKFNPPQTDSSWYLVYNIINHALNKMMDYILQYYSHFGIEFHRQSFSYKVSFFQYYIYCSILAISFGNTSIQLRSILTIISVKFSLKNGRYHKMLFSHLETFHTIFFMCICFPMLRLYEKNKYFHTRTSN